MEIRVKCKVKSLHLPELSRDLKKDLTSDFTSEEYQKSLTLRKAIEDGWVIILKKAVTNQKPQVIEAEKQTTKVVENKPDEQKKPKRGRKKKDEKNS